MAFLNEQGLATLWGKVKGQVADAKAYTDEKIGEIVIPEIVQSDWNVNDASNPAFIKNRTHYEGNGTVLVDYASNDWFINEAENTASMFFSDELILPEDIVPGNTYTVIVDGVHYVTVAFETVDSMMGESVYALGNGSIAYTSGGDSSLPFFIDKYKTFTTINTIYIRNDNGSTYHSISVVSGLATKQLDEKFIPSSIARSSEVGELANKKPGRMVYGEEFTYTNSEGTEVTTVAGFGAEIFNEINANVATGVCSHAEGSSTIASGNHAHAEGMGTTAGGTASHAEGIVTRASGQGSHAEGEGTVAVYTRYGPQHVQGKYNVIDTSGIYAHIVGGGSEDEPRNIHTVDYNGIGWYPNIYLGGNDEHTATIKGFYVHNSTTNLPEVVEGAILIAYDE